jgi:ABC-type glycerol-3-phosphate transport system substrate-binding protein
MNSRQRRVLRQAAIAVLSALAAPLAGAQDLVIGQVSSQTSPVTAMNAKGLYAGINVYFEHINANDLAARATAAIEGRKGPDILQLLNNFPHLYAGGLEDLLDVADRTRPFLGYLGETARNQVVELRRHTRYRVGKPRCDGLSRRAARAWRPLPAV